VCVSGASQETPVVTTNVECSECANLSKVVSVQTVLCREPQLHNCTVYVSNNKDVHSYVWDVVHLRLVHLPVILSASSGGNGSTKKIVSIPGDCAYQNKNNSC
jgi:hypothetical protein